MQESGDGATYCWRNIFSCINLLRILNKLTKWKHSRTMVSACITPCHSGGCGDDDDDDDGDGDDDDDA